MPNSLGFGTPPNIQVPIDSDNALFITKPAAALTGFNIVSPVTTGLGASISTSTITAGSLLKLTSTSTVGNASKIFEIAGSGTNSTASKTNYGLYLAISNAGTTSTNVGLYLNAVGATNNYALIVPSGGGFVGIGTSSPTSTLQVSGSIASSIVTKTGNYTLDATNTTVLFKGTTLTATLPAASGCNGRIYIIVNQDVSVLTISSFQNFLDVATTTMASGTAITIQSNGTNWYQIC